jgi:3-oxoacyl-[acyl-carrier protein] reductase
MKLADRIALITGGGSGIGRATALAFAREGARVVVNDVNLAAAEETVSALGGAERGRAVVADVSDSAQVRRMFADLEATLGGLDILVNNAGIGTTDRAERQHLREKVEARLAETRGGGPVRTHLDITRDMTDEAWRRMISVHLDGTFFCTREALRIMSARNRGVIINLSSVAALTGLEHVPHYCAAKGGILAFTRAVAREVASRGIRINAICPGYIDTPMTAGTSDELRTLVAQRTPLGRWGTPEEIAATALFLASDDSSFFTGQWLSPNGGMFIG